MTSPTSPAIELFIQYKWAILKEEFADRNTSICGNPPNFRDSYDSRDSVWMVWSSKGSLKQASPQELSHKEHYKTSSVFWCSRCNQYKAIPLDCVVTDVTTDSHQWDGWQPIRFKWDYIGPYGSDEEVCLSIIGHMSSDDCHEEQLGASPPIGLIPAFLPETNRNNSSNKPKGTTQIAGDPSLLFALLLLSGPPTDALSSITSFQPGKRWQTNQTGNFRQTRWGVVVSIGFNNQKHTAQDVESWANGKHGGLITNVPSTP